MKVLNKYPMIKLDNGLKVVNYSSPHPYTFDTGEILPACEDSVSRKSMLKAEHAMTSATIRDIDIQEVSIKYRLPAWMAKELINISAIDDVDIILIPYPVMTAVKETEYGLLKSRVCKLTDRVTKVISSTQFCV